MYTNTAPNKHIVAKQNIQPWNPTKSDRIGKHLLAKKPDKNKVETPKVTPISFSLFGITSAVTPIGNDWMAHPEMKTVNENATIGNQSYA